MLILHDIHIFQLIVTTHRLITRLLVWTLIGVVGILRLIFITFFFQNNGPPTILHWTPISFFSGGPFSDSSRMPISTAEYCVDLWEVCDFFFCADLIYAMKFTVQEFLLHHDLLGVLFFKVMEKRLFVVQMIKSTINDVCMRGQDN